MNMLIPQQPLIISISNIWLLRDFRYSWIFVIYPIGTYVSFSTAIKFITLEKIKLIVTTNDKSTTFGSSFVR